MEYEQQNDSELEVGRGSLLEVVSRPLSVTKINNRVAPQQPLRSHVLQTDNEGRGVMIGECNQGRLPNECQRSSGVQKDNMDVREGRQGPSTKM